MLTTPENKLEIEGFRPALSKHLSLESEPYAFMHQVIAYAFSNDPIMIIFILRQNQPTTVHDSCGATSLYLQLSCWMPERLKLVFTDLSLK